MILTRRKFFSFFGTGVVMAAKPELLLPSPRRPKDGELIFWGDEIANKILPHPHPRDEAEFWRIIKGELYVFRFVGRKDRMIKVTIGG